MQRKARVSKRPWQSISKIAFLILLVVMANYAADWVVEFLKFELRPRNEDAIHRAIMTAAVIYALLIAVPFVPGVEIGLALISMIGPGIISLVYLCTIAGLSISFFIGRSMSLDGLIRLFEWLKFMKPAQLFRTIQPLSGEKRLEFLVSNAPNGLLPFLLRHRHVALALAINLPGNFLIGGGGGLALMAGVSRLYSAPAFLATIALAVAPVPLAILFFGATIFSG